MAPMDIKNNDVTYLDYDKITDTLLRFDDRHTLKFIVNLCYADRYGKRVANIRENRYTGKNYKDTPEVLSITRKINFNLLIDDKSNVHNNVVFGIYDIYNLECYLRVNVLPLYQDNSALYGKSLDGSGVYLTANVTLPPFYTYGGKSLNFVPVVCESAYGAKSEGIRICLNSSDFIDIPVNLLKGLYMYISRTDFYAAACNMLTYVKSWPYCLEPYDINPGR